MSSEVEGSLCGLCGDFDGQAAGDYALAADNEFWLAGPTSLPSLFTTALDRGDQCRAGITTTTQPGGTTEPPCIDLTVDEQDEADRLCSIIEDAEGPYGACHRFVDPEEFVGDCQFDVCELGPTVGCDVIIAYEEACSVFKVPFVSVVDACGVCFGDDSSCTTDPPSTTSTGGWIGVSTGGDPGSTETTTTEATTTTGALIGTTGGGGDPPITDTTAATTVDDGAFILGPPSGGDPALTVVTEGDFAALIPNAEAEATFAAELVEAIETAEPDVRVKSVQLSPGSIVAVVGFASPGEVAAVEAAVARGRIQSATAGTSWSSPSSAAGGGSSSAGAIAGGLLAAAAVVALVVVAVLHRRRSAATKLPEPTAAPRASSTDAFCYAAPKVAEAGEGTLRFVSTHRSNPIGQPAVYDTAAAQPKYQAAPAAPVYEEAAGGITAHLYEVAVSGAEPDYEDADKPAAGYLAM